MTTTQLLSGLPAELLLCVGEHLNVSDCRSLSSVNSQFRRFLLPTLFEGLLATNRYEDAEILRGLVPKVARYVQRLNFELYMNESEDREYLNDPPKKKGPRTLTVKDADPVVWNLLSRRVLAKVKTLRITFCPQPEDFDGDGWDDDGCGGGIYINDDEEDLEQIVKKRRTFPWRALYNHALETIATGSVKLHRLEVCNLPPKATMTQTADEWKAMLKSLEEFELSLWGGDNGAGWHANTNQGYLDSIEALENLFFEHLTSVKRVKFAAHKDNPVGCPGIRHVPIPFGADHMPQLQHLELRDCFVDFALTACLNDKRGQIHSLHLNNCYSAGHGQNTGLADAAIPWSDFFSSLRTSQPNLQSLTISEDRPPPLTNDEQFWGHSLPEEERGPFVPAEDEPEDVKAVRRALREEGRRLFAYVCLDDKYGMVFASEEVNVERFLEGSDGREWEGLMGVVEGNQRRQRDDGV